MNEFNEQVQNNDEHKNFGINILLVVLAILIIFLIIVQFTGRCHRCIPMTKAESDKAWIDEVIARVEICIRDSDSEGIKVVEGVYMYDGNETICNSKAGYDFARLITTSLEGASSVSKVDSKKDIIKITLEINVHNEYGYNITAEFVES